MVDFNDRAQQGEEFTVDDAAPVETAIDLVRAYATCAGIEAMQRDRMVELVSLARLPAWPMATTPGHPGHGWGTALEEQLGGGVEPGEMIGVGASSAGAGKTAFVAQLADGLALRSAAIAGGDTSWGRTLTPVIFASEMSVETLTKRTWSRWLRVSYSQIRDRGNSDAWDRGIEALTSGPLAQAWQWKHHLPLDQVVGKLRVVVRALRNHVEQDCPGFRVVPVVFIDPIQRVMDGSAGEVEALNAASDAIRRVTSEEKVITFVTSDTNKTAATGNGSTDLVEAGVGAFRGSYRLQHDLDAALFLSLDRAEDGGDNSQQDAAGNYFRPAKMVVVKTRNGNPHRPWPAFRWYGSYMRFEPGPVEEPIARKGGR